MFEFFKSMILKIDGIRFITAFTMLGVFILVAYALVFIHIPTENKEVLIHLLGIVEGGVLAIVGYEFGSSKATKKLDDKTP
jgi:hypothetical protein